MLGEIRLLLLFSAGLRRTTAWPRCTPETKATSTVTSPAIPSTSVITAKAANDYHFKTGQRSRPSGTGLFYPVASCGRKSNSVMAEPDLQLHR